MRHIADTAHPLRATRRCGAGARAALAADGRALALKALRLMLPLLLLFLLALGQAASAHPTGSQHQPHAVKTMMHHAEATDQACCGDHAQGEDGNACLAQCVASCSYCAPLPVPTAFPGATIKSPPPAVTEPMRGATASPHLRPPSFS